MLPENTELCYSANVVLVTPFWKENMDKLLIDCQQFFLAQWVSVVTVHFKKKDHAMLL